MAENRYMMGVQIPDKVVMLRPIPTLLTKDEALEVAAWLVALADPDMGAEGGKFQQKLEEVLDS